MEIADEEYTHDDWLIGKVGVLVHKINTFGFELTTGILHLKHLVKNQITLIFTTKISFYQNLCKNIHKNI